MTNYQATKLESVLKGDSKLIKRQEKLEQEFDRYFKSLKKFNELFKRDDKAYISAQQMKDAYSSQL